MDWRYDSSSRASALQMCALSANSSPTINTYTYTYIHKIAINSMNFQASQPIFPFLCGSGKLHFSISEMEIE
jgi:hypothetical protein